MFDLNFRIEDAEAARYTASPEITLKLRIDATGAPLPIHTILLQCQVQIEPGRRPYLSSEQAQMHDLFGEPARWGKTLHPLLWTNAAVTVRGFESSTVVDVPLPCTFDFNVATTKYLNGLTSGEIPICVFLSGTVFHDNGEGGLQISKVSWDREASYRVPISCWKQLMASHYGDAAWLALSKDVFNRLYRYKLARGLSNFEQALDAALTQAERTENDVEKVSP